MAITVIGGLLVSTLLTLVVIPVVYDLLDRRADAYYAARGAHATRGARASADAGRRRGQASRHDARRAQPSRRPVTADHVLRVDGGDRPDRRVPAAAGGVPGGLRARSCSCSCPYPGSTPRGSGAHASCGRPRKRWRRMTGHQAHATRQPRADGASIFIQFTDWDRDIADRRVARRASASMRSATTCPTTCSATSCSSSRTSDQPVLRCAWPASRDLTRRVRPDRPRVQAAHRAHARRGPGRDLRRAAERGRDRDRPGPPDRARPRASTSSATRLQAVNFSVSAGADRRRRPARLRVQPVGEITRPAASCATW